MAGHGSREAGLAMNPATFRTIGHRLVDQIAARLEALPGGPITPDGSPSGVRDALDLHGSFPEAGMDAAQLLE